MKIPFLSFDYMHSFLRNEAIESFKDFYDSHYYILGNKVKQFEKEYAAFTGTSYCVGVSNGLDALFMALKTLNIQKGDEVIVPSNTYIATALAVTYTGATPVFAEPDIQTYNLTAENIKKKITNKTKAVIPVHLYGQACEINDIISLCSAENLFVVEDNAQAHGAAYNRKLTGSFGKINANSFYPGKNLGALGDAGAVTTDDLMLAEKAMLLRNYGSKEKYYNEVIGFNKRLDEMQAAFLSLKLKYLDLFTKERVKIAAVYFENLKNTGDIILPEIASGATHVFHLFVVRTKRRNELQNYLQSKGIGTLIHYPVPAFMQKAYEYLETDNNDFPIAKELAKTVLSLPLWPGLTEMQLEYIIECIKDFYK